MGETQWFLTPLHVIKIPSVHVLFSTERIFITCSVIIVRINMDGSESEIMMITLTDHLNLSVIGFDGEKVKMICCGVKHSIALTQNGRVFCWGSISSVEYYHCPISYKPELVPIDIPIKNMCCS
jgi:alpha-tubulin suppressor-like RCC1 family protein